MGDTRTGHRTQSAARTPAPRRRTLPIVVGVVVAVAILAFVLRPSPYSKVTNLGSRGSAIVAFGDSLTAGYEVAEAENYPSQVSALIDKTIINAGVSGDTTGAALARIDRDVLERNPRIVIVGLGGNDYLRSVPIATTEENLRAIVREVQGAGAMVVLLGFSFPSLTTDYASMYESVAREEGCLFVPRVLKGILSKNELKVDTIHPNAKGYVIMAERIADPLETLIRKADRAR